jgi:formylglycine-generating enzyme required for sulfatase activity
MKTFSLGLVTVLLLVGGCRDQKALPEPASTTAEISKAIYTKSGIDMVLIPAGEFTLGDDGGEKDERPAHRVRLSAFYMDDCEVTQASFEAIMGRNPSKAKGANRPVERVSWLAAIQYCNMRSTCEGLKPCYDLSSMACDFAADGYRLPTEAEWEYACRAGTTAPWSFGDKSGEITRFAWFKGNAEKTTHAVKQKQPNGWGLYDMHGNAAEWCNDYYADHYDPLAAENPRGPATGSARVLRGGSWMSDEDDCRCSARHSEPPVFADVCFGSDSYGFRCVRGTGPAGK